MGPGERGRSGAWRSDLHACEGGGTDPGQGVGDALPEGQGNVPEGPPAVLTVAERKNQKFQAPIPPRLVLPDRNNQS